MVTLLDERLEEVTYKRPLSLTGAETHYCPGCTHGTAHKLVAEVIDELGIRDDTILIASVGCSVFSYRYFELDSIVAPHGRATAVATGVKRVHPQQIVFTYQGDGDLASIGIAETIHAAARGEKLTVIFLNNAIYGMTGGQMAPTSLLGQVTNSSPYGRSAELAGYPLRIAELLAGFEGTVYSVRRSLHDARHVLQARKAIRLAFEAQLHGLGFSIVELLSTCPTNWGMTPTASCDWVVDNMIPQYPLGDYKVAPELAALSGRRSRREGEKS
jgi:2-oxoglutarate ferredoxin oxidoreductase subunit beta